MGGEIPVEIRIPTRAPPRRFVVGLGKKETQTKAAKDPAPGPTPPWVLPMPQNDATQTPKPTIAPLCFLEEEDHFPEIVRIVQSESTCASASASNVSKPYDESHMDHKWMTTVPTPPTGLSMQSDAGDAARVN